MAIYHKGSNQCRKTKFRIHPLHRPIRPIQRSANAEPIPSQVLKSAYNAFKKRWKLTRLDYESRIGRGPLSSRL